MPGSIDPTASARPYAFVSYASADRERVESLVAALERAGVVVWLDRGASAGGRTTGGRSPRPSGGPPPSCS